MGNRGPVILLLGALLCSPVTAKKATSPTPVIPVDRVIPGWVQLSSGKPVKGILLLGGFLGTIAGAAIQNHRGNLAYDRYLECRDATQIGTLRRETERHFKSRNLFVLGIAAITVIHFLDLTFSKKSNASIQGKLARGGIHLDCRLTF